ncbi:MAG: putative Dihydrolipoyl dehydrogenase, component of pyruvate and 2-oxoglutarate dehydrogenase [Verrucomicrobiales bacterium]|nr:putative Dihydrolipoyl dehydrogenase, component of pyruvate and 2-oxoglutarate dehydrogenase [Verrucomicrobiales bacterium]
MSAAENDFDYDVVVIGGGSAGYAAARTAVAEGLKVAVVEGGREVGGLCILRGCMPTKALLYASEVLHLAQHSQAFGVRSGEITFDFAAIMQRKNRLIKEFSDYRTQQLNAGHFKFIRANATFVDPHTIQLSDGHSIRSKHFVLATGSVVAPCSITQLCEVGYITSDEALSLDKLPKSLIILGGGAVAVEFAQFFNRLGVRVTLVQRSEHLLKEEETDAAIELEKVFRREGMTVFTGTHLTHAWREGGLKGVAFEYEGQPVRVAAEEILFALGRIPNTANLALDKAGVQMSYGRFPANSKMQTSAKHIFAAGDCTGLHEIVHIAIQQGEFAAWNIAHPTAMKTIDYRLASSVVFTEPQLGRVGLTEKFAKAEKIPYLAASHPFCDHGKSMTMEALDGFVKLLADPGTGEIIGGTCLGPSGGELIHEIIAAMHKRMTVHELAAMPHYHPTLAEIWTYPAEELAGKIPRKEIIS